MMPKIVTTYICPPIGTTAFDWQAVTDSYDLGSPIGYGRTEDEARADLEAQLDELRPEEA